tara:strand:+ start:729 stop:1496 length:768 start_codon:yes stop_codon:yes gene_type:complete
MANRYPLIVDSTIKEIVAGDTLVADGLLLSGTTPTLTIGDAGAEDTKIVFDGNAQDFYIGLDDSADDLVIGLGSSVGATPAISIAENQVVTFSQPPVGIAAASLTAMSVTATAAELNYLDIATLGLTAASKAVTADANGVITLDNGFSEEYAAVTSSSNVVSLNLRTANNFSHDLTENTTISFTNPAASGKVSAATLRIIQGSTARTITWNSSIKWAADTAPTLTTTNDAVDIFVFYTVDGGTTYYGFTAGQVMS